MVQRPNVEKPTTRGETIAFIREAHNMSQTQLATEISVSQTILSRIESDLREVGAETLCRIAAVLDFDPQLLLRGIPDELASAAAAVEDRAAYDEAFDEAADAIAKWMAIRHRLNGNRHHPNDVLVAGAARAASEGKLGDACHWEETGVIGPPEEPDDPADLYGSEEDYEPDDDQEVGSPDSPLSATGLTRPKGMAF